MTEEKFTAMRINRRHFVTGALSTGVLTVAPGHSSAEEIQDQSAAAKTKVDWLIDPGPYAAHVTRPDGQHIELSNGLVRRAFCLTPNAATIALDNLMTGQSELRSIRPEASLNIDNYELDIGGLIGQPIQNYLLPEWLEKMSAEPRALRFTHVEESKAVERFPWKRVSEWSTGLLPWPPPGVALTFHYEPGPETEVSNILVRVHYELYDGIPLLSKWIEVENKGTCPIMLGSFKAEILATVESSVPKISPGAPPQLLDKLVHLHVATDYAFGGDMEAAADNPAVQWKSDPLYRSGIEYYGEGHPTLLECAPRVGPELEINPGETWTSFHVFELLHDSSDAERRGLAMRKMMRTLAPWSQENPIYMHARYARPQAAKEAIDQCAAVGFEMVILSFGSGFNIENNSPAYMAEMKDLADYARAKGIAIGGYSLLASRGGQPEDLIIDVKTGQPGGGRFGPSPCLGSKWAEEYFRKLHAFFEQTGMSVFENDGSYPGDFCASTHHPGHRGYLDSQWKQWEVMRDFYRWCCGRGIYLTVPDWYFLNGQNKTGMGYVENNWSLPREYQPLIERQNIYDGTWEKTPSMGWMHVPLMQYHGGGAAATLEPLHEHLAQYEMRLADLFGAGVQAAWRGERLFDTDETKALVKKWVDFYKRNRAILDSDIIHLRRPDGQDWDGILHVNPTLKMRGLAMIYNPLNQAIIREIKLPLYYTGLTRTVNISPAGSKAKIYDLDSNFAVTITVNLPAQSNTWLNIS